MKKMTASGLAFMGMMTALVFVSNYISIPTGYSRLHVANAVCLLAGMLFGGFKGGIIAGIGSAIFDLTFPAYAAEFWITFINKGAMALACGIIVNDKGNTLSPQLRAIIGALCGAVLYIALYMIKSILWARYVVPIPPETVGAVMISKIGSSAVNGLFAVIVAPLLYAALHPALKKAGLWKD